MLCWCGLDQRDGVGCVTASPSISYLETPVSSYLLKEGSSSHWR